MSRNVQYSHFSASTQIHSVQPQALQEEYSYSVCLSGAADTRLQLGLVCCWCVGRVQTIGHQTCLLIVGYAYVLHFCGLRMAKASMFICYRLHF